jgi:hypothetical protein
MSKQTMQNDFFVGRQIKFQAFGVKIGIEAEKIQYLEKIYQMLEKTFPNGFEKVREQEIEYRFIIKSKKTDKTEKGERFELFRNNEKVIQDVGGEFFFQMVESEVRLSAAQSSRIPSFWNPFFLFILSNQHHSDRNRFRSGDSTD